MLYTTLISTMLDYSVISSYLELHLLPLLVGDPQALGWLGALHTGEKGRHLGASLAIDLKAGAFGASRLAQIIRSLHFQPSPGPGEKSQEAAIAFVKLVSGDPTFSCWHPDPPTIDKSELYARSMTLYQFCQFHPDFRKVYSFSLGDDDLHDARSILLSDRHPLDCIPPDFGIRGGGATGLVWVTSAAAVEDVCQHSTNPAFDLRFSLGLTNLHEMCGSRLYSTVVLKYLAVDASFQPTTLDSNILGLLPFPYLSAKRGTGWGESWSVNGKAKTLPERIHRPAAPFPWNTVEVELLDGTPALKEIPVDYNALIGEGVRRFREI